MTSASAVLVLWDIDHTLIDPGPATARAYAEAFGSLTGRPAQYLIDMHGRTERWIAAEMLDVNGIRPHVHLVSALMDAAARALVARRQQIAEESHLLDGAMEAVTALGELPRVHQTVLTGNSRLSAELKLSLFGLASLLDLTIGAFGNDAYDRNDLVGHAWRRASEAAGHCYQARDTVIIGDTPHDVATARRHGTRMVGVSTGITSAADLLAAGAETVLTSLSDTRRLVQIITNGTTVGALSGRIP